MYINEISKKTSLTKKSINYYEKCSLIHPVILNNGYRFYSNEDIEKLQKIKILRSLNLSTSEIRDFLEDNNYDLLKNILLKKKFHDEFENEKNEILSEIISTKSFNNIDDRIMILNNKKSILDRIIDAFPGYFGRFFAINFSYFLKDTVIDKNTISASNKIIDFLDTVSFPELSGELEDYLVNMTNYITQSDMEKIIEEKINNINNKSFEEFYSENKNYIDEYEKYKNSEEYKSSLAFEIYSILKSFMSDSGYYDIFIPQMRILSKSYNEYYENALKRDEEYKKIK